MYSSMEKYRKSQILKFSFLSELLLCCEYVYVFIICIIDELIVQRFFTQTADIAKLQLPQKNMSFIVGYLDWLG